MTFVTVFFFGFLRDLPISFIACCRIDFRVAELLRSVGSETMTNRCFPLSNSFTVLGGMAATARGVGSACYTMATVAADDMLMDELAFPAWRVLDAATDWTSRVGLTVEVKRSRHQLAYVS